MLKKEQIQQIEREAKELYPDTYGYNYHSLRTGYIQGATKHAAPAALLVEALEKIYNNTSTDPLFSISNKDILRIAKQALDNFKNNKG